MLQEVMPTVAARYRVATESENVGLGGSSYGAVAAVYVVLQDPARFGKLLAESTITWAGNGQLVRDSVDIALAPERAWFGVGGREAHYPGLHLTDSLQSMTQQLAENFRKAPMRAFDVQFKVDPEGGHNEDSWSKRFPDAILFLFGKSDTPERVAMGDSDMELAYPRGKTAVTLLEFLLPGGCSLLNFSHISRVTVSSRVESNYVEGRGDFAVNRNIPILCTMLGLVGAFLGCGGASLQPQPTSTSSAYRQTNLVSDRAGNAAHTDLFLINPWGVAFQPGQSFFIADNNRGTAEVFDPSGAPASPAAVRIPAPSGSGLPSTPTGIVWNPIAQDFLVRGTPAQFLFTTEEGTISTWATINGNIPSSALLAVDDSGRAAVYKGLAILTPQCCREYLALADFHNDFIATYDVSFNLLGTQGAFKDHNLPTGYAPFNIQQIGTDVFVTYAVQDAAGTNPLTAAGNGIVDIFDQEGNFIRRFASNGTLNAPWGVVQASPNFGPFSNDILIGNFGDGTINAFDPVSGSFLGQLKDSAGHVITNPGLWALIFRTDGVGNQDTLYFTAGSSGEDHGLFGTINPQN